jgi:hypothetical protein
MHLIYGLLAALIVAGPAPVEVVGGGVTILVSRDFRNPPLVEKTLLWQGSSVLDLLNGVATVETAFGGAFVERINGVPGKKDRSAGRAWHYYVNGMIAQVGAGAYRSAPGDVMVWDFHPWEGVRQVQALIGCYPQPFTGSTRDGSAPCRILFSEAAHGKARELAAALMHRGALEVRVQPLSSAELSDGVPAVIIGPWDEISRVPAVRTAVAHGDRCGLFIDCDGTGMRVLDLKRKPRASYPKAGAIIAVAGGTSIPTPLWLVTGTDTASACLAADVLILRPEKIRGMAAAVLSGDAVHPAPIIDE